MRISNLSIRHPVTTTMVFLALFLLGIVSLTRLPVDLFPDVSMPTVAVYTTYAGVGPFEVESGVTKPIEEAMTSLNGVEQVSSTSSEGVSLVIINFNWSIDMDTVVSDVREQLNQIEDLLPEGADRSGIFKFNPQQLPSLVLNVYSETKGIDVRRLTESMIVPALEKVEGVARAEVFGGSIAQVVCRLDLDELSKRRLPIAQVMQAFQGENVDLPAGSITVEDRYLILRTIGGFESVEDIGYVLVGYTGQVPVFLKDVADISIGALGQEEYVRAGGADGVAVAVRRQPGHNTVEVNEAAFAALDELKARLPGSVRIEVRTDQSVSVNQSIGGVATAAWQGGLLAVVVLLFFLRNIRSTLIIAVVIPVAVIATFSLMDFGGLTMNMVSLMGITLGVGMFVDNSIVVLESTYRKQLAGMSPADAAREGTSEVGKPIIASTLTTVAVFIPMLFVQGIAGLIFDDLSLTVSFALIVSLAVALTLIPLLSSRLLKLEGVKIHTSDGRSRRVHDDGADGGDYDELSLADIEVVTGNRFIDGISARIQAALQRLDSVYERIIAWALDHTGTVVVSAVLLFLSSVGSILLLGMEFLPETDEGEFAVYMETRIGSSFEATTRKVVQMESIITEETGDRLTSLSSEIGRGGSIVDAGSVGSNLATLNVKLVDKDERQDSIWEIVNRVADRFDAELLDVNYTVSIEGIGSLVSAATGDSSPIVIKFTGDDLDRLYAYAQSIEDVVETIEGVRNVRVSHKTGKPELQFVVRRRDALSLGLSPLEIAAAIRAAYKGMTVTRYNTDEADYDVVLILRDEDRRIQRFSSMFFVNPAGTRIPLENLVDIEEGTGPLSIRRENRTRVMEVTAALTGERALSRVMDDLRSKVDDLGPPPVGISIEYSGSSQQMVESFGDLFLALVFAVALVYMVMASQFESLLHPFIVMFSVPFAIIGLVAALLITNTTFNLLAFVGGILLVGIVVNNAIVLIDYMNLLRERGMALRTAVIHAGKTRLKPILMTVLTTVFGLLPMSLGLGTGSEIRAPMGRAVVGGLLTSTLVTLVLIPVIYWLVESKLRRSTRHVDQSNTAPVEA